MRHLRSIAFALFLTCLGGSALADLKVIGSSTIQPIAREAAASFKQDAALLVEVNGGGSDAGIRAVLTGAADIGMVSRTLTAEEARQLNSVTIARDGIAIAVNERNPVVSLSYDQVHALFAGHVSDWRELGNSGFSGVVIPVIKAPGRASRQIFDQHFRIGVLLPTHAVELGSNLASLLYLSSDPQAVGYVSLGSLEEARRRGLRTRSVALDGALPSIQGCVAGTYPLCRPLLLVTKKKPGREAQRFIDFFLSTPGRAVIEHHGFMPTAAAQ